MSDKDCEQDIFEIIAHAGNAKSFVYEALVDVEAYDFTSAEQRLERANEELTLAHQTQTRLIQGELNGSKVEKSLLLIHAQDHLMTALSEHKLIEHLLRIVKKMQRGAP
jgi:cellobiose PTS system EIIA component